MKSYSTLIFDAFDTVIHIERKKLPQHAVGDRVGNTTAPRVYEVYRAEVGTGSQPCPSFQDFVKAFLESSAEAYRRRRANLREISSPDRFRIMLELLGNSDGTCSPDLPGRLARTHMRTLQPALEVRPPSRQLLDWAHGEGYRLAMISNFDYSPALYECLDLHDVRQMFELIVVSDEFGWRKPHPEIFGYALNELGITAGKALFIGDRLDIDVDGAVGSGMDAVWIDTGREVWTPEHSRPVHTIGELGELRGVLENDR